MKRYGYHVAPSDPRGPLEDPSRHRVPHGQAVQALTVQSSHQYAPHHLGGRFLLKLGVQRFSSSVKMMTKHSDEAYAAICRIARMQMMIGCCAA